MTEPIEGRPNYPKLAVLYDPETLEERVLDKIFDSLLYLDINRAENAIMRGEEADQEQGGKFEIIVSTDETGNALQFAIPSITYVRVILDPSLLDQADDTQATFFERCQRLVKALRDAPAAADDDYKHPKCGPFVFWCWKEDVERERSAREWATVAEIWAVD